MLTQKRGGSVVSITSSMVVIPIAGVPASLPMISKSSMRRARRRLAEVHFMRLQGILYFDGVDDHPVTNFHICAIRRLGTIEERGRVNELDFNALLVGGFYGHRVVCYSGYGSHDMDHSTMRMKENRSTCKKQSGNEGSALHRRSFQ
jgi:hypothetical protein